VLKWRYQSRDENLVPLSINAWPSASGKDCYVNIEYESNVDYDLQGVVIVIPLPHLGHAPTVNQVRQGQIRLKWDPVSRNAFRSDVFANCCTRWCLCRWMETGDFDGRLLLYHSLPLMLPELYTASHFNFVPPFRTTVCTASVG
jgi:hypothetical protein